MFQLYSVEPCNFDTLNDTFWKFGQYLFYDTYFARDSLRSDFFTFMQNNSYLRPDIHANDTYIMFYVVTQILVSTAQIALVK